MEKNYRFMKRYDDGGDGCGGGCSGKCGQKCQRRKRAKIAFTELMNRKKWH